MQEAPVRHVRIGALDVAFEDTPETETEYDLTMNLHRDGAGYGGVLLTRDGVLERARRTRWSNSSTRRWTCC